MSQLSPVHPDWRKLQDAFFLGVFFIIISMGISLPLLGVKDLPSFENRRMARLPSLKPVQDLLGLPRRCDQYLEDHFAQRNRLIHALYSIRLNWLSKLPWSQEAVFPSVVIGLDGWLYYSDEGNMEDYQRARTFTEEQLSRIKHNLDSLFHRFDAEGITLVIALAPNKETIYPEYVPGSIPRLSEVSRMDQLVSFLNTPRRARVLDLRAPLLAAKKDRQVYFRTDTHWNSFGAYVVYAQIMEQLQSTYPELQAKSLQDFQVVSIPWHGDLANFLTMGEILVEQTEQLLPILAPRSQIVAQVGPNSLEATREIPGSGLPKALLIHDSFGLHLIPFLAEHFSRLTNRWAPYDAVQPIPLIDQDLIEIEQPDIVILIITERYLQYLSW